MNKCDYCICKTCAIAEVNGGAPGCGDCYNCMKKDYRDMTNHCNEYYNPKDGNISLSYLLRKAEEERNENNNLGE